LIQPISILPRLVDLEFARATATIPKVNRGPAMSEMQPLIRRRDEVAVAVLTLADTASRNSLSEAMFAALDEALAQLEADASVRAVVLAAEGPVFCSGHNLKEMQAHRNDPDGGRASVAALMAQCSAVMMRINRLRTPVIAAVEGLATAAGCQLVASCDLAVAGAEARFCTPGVNMGLFCSTPAVALSRNVTAKAAMEMLLTGEPIDAAKAERIGLVNRVTAKGEALGEATELARRIATRSAEAIAFGKPAFQAQAGLPLEAAYALASEVMARNFLSPDAKEGIVAFLEKRAPHWPAGG
jgi:enoyl-CoA hydratase/carnithine racemase